MADNKGMIYKREVSKITVQESHRFTNSAKCQPEKSIMEEEKYFQASSYLKDKTLKFNQTDKSVTYKSNLCIERNYNKVESTCDVCGVVCTGIDNFKLHIEGKKHNKKLKERKILQQMGSISRNIDISPTINCDLCKKKFANLEAYLQHCKGEANQAISSLYGLAKKLEDPSQFSEDSRCTKSSLTHCDVCKIWCEGPMAYDLHIETREHYRKGHNLKELVVMRDVTITSEECNMLTCETCGKAFNGPIPYKQHLMSNSHSKKNDIAKELINYKQHLMSNSHSKKDDIVKEMINYKQHLMSNSHSKKDDIVKEMMKVNIICGSELHCKDCGKKFSGVVPFDSHLRGSSHKRQIKKNNLWKNLEEEHPEVLDYSMFGIHGEDTKSDGNVKLDCKTCHLEFKKTEDVQEHYTGLKHREETKKRDSSKEITRTY